MKESTNMRVALLRLEILTLEMNRPLDEAPKVLRGGDSVLLQFEDRWLELDTLFLRQPAWEQLVRLEIAALFKPRNLGRYSEVVSA